MADESTAKTRGRFSLSQQVIIVVKEEDGTEHQYPILKYQLESSKFFQACLSEKWTEGQTRLIRLEDVDICVFEIYLRWLHEGSLKTGKHDDDTSELDLAVRGFDTTALHILINLYSMGLRFLDSKFRNTIITSLHLRNGGIFARRFVWEMDNISYACATLPENCMMVRWMAERLMGKLYTWPGSSRLHAEVNELEIMRGIPRSFLEKVSICALKYKKAAPYSPCLYHDHDETEEEDCDIQEELQNGR